MRYTCLKFYSLTRLGRGQLQKEAANWARLSDAIKRVVRLKEAWGMLPGPILASVLSHWRHRSERI
jgi:hypothetical protein